MSWIFSELAIKILYFLPLESDGHDPVTHHRPTYPGIMHMSFLLVLPR